ncbi:MAG TPA: hypothetical protein VNF47_05020 [Streptosporangiaceae bacterium]|nr:hypothetical protein [Streptosporangiaceae bacterium]
MPDAPAAPDASAGSGVSPQPRWRILVTPRWIGWHLFAVATVVGMMWLGDWQFRRALAGNTLSWAYTFEWPIFAVFGVFFWSKTIKDELNPPAQRTGQRDEITLPAGARSPGASHQAGPARVPGTGQPGPEDIELAEYNAYLARLQNEVKSHGKWHGLR